MRLGNEGWWNQGNGRGKGDSGLLRRLREEGEVDPDEIRRCDRLASFPVNPNPRPSVVPSADAGYKRS
jgi:hypothetical protein